MPTVKSAFWFTIQHCGRNFLATMVKPVSEKPESRARQTTGFVLRELLSCLQQMYRSLKLIQERINHHSTTALCMYECTSSQQQMSVSSIIASVAPKKLVSEIPLPLTGPEQNLSKSKLKFLLTIVKIVLST